LYVKTINRKLILLKVMNLVQMIVYNMAS